MPKSFAAEYWWELLNDSPKIAGPWEKHWTEEQRVETMMVRRLPRCFCREKVVMVYGPLFEVGDYGPDAKRTRWLATLERGYEIHQLWEIPNHRETVFNDAEHTGSFSSMEAAMAGADERLKHEGWLLVEGKP